jgi:hypothetical protein
VTENFFKPLVAGSVPVYLGAPNIRELATAEHCFIDTADFEGPAELPAYLPIPPPMTPPTAATSPGRTARSTRAFALCASGSASAAGAALPAPAPEARCVPSPPGQRVVKLPMSYPRLRPPQTRSWWFA